MTTHSFDIDLDFKDVLAILFRRNKVCPECKSKVKRKTASFDDGMGWDKDISENKLNFEYVQKYTVKVMYYCSTCSKYFKPSIFW